MRWIFIWHEVSPIQYLRKMDIFWLKIKLYSIYKPHSSHQTHKKYLLLVLNRFYKLVNPKARMSLIWRFRSSIVCKPPPPVIFSDWFHLSSQRFCSCLALAFPRIPEARSILWNSWTECWFAHYSSLSKPAVCSYYSTSHKRPFYSRLMQEYNLWY